jgi:hypothetical protein
MDSKLLQDFESSFNEMKKELGFKATLEELDEVFYFRDFILQSGFVSPKLSRMLCGRIRDTYYLWINKLHVWIVPNPSSMIAISENEVFNDKEKEEIKSILKKFLAFTSQNVVIGLAKDKKKEAEYIDTALSLWKDSKQALLYFTKKVNDYWNSEVEE